MVIAKPASHSTCRRRGPESSKPTQRSSPSDKSTDENPPQNRPQGIACIHRVCPRNCSARPERAPFKMGVLTVKTGPLASLAFSANRAFTTFMKENNNMLSGRKCRVDHHGYQRRARARRTRRKNLLSVKRLTWILGPYAAAEFFAITDYVRDHQDATNHSRSSRRRDTTHPIHSSFKISATSGQCARSGSYAAKEFEVQARCDGR